MIDIKFKPTEELEKELLEIFDDMYERHYPQILEWSHIELWNRSGKQYTTADWKNFKTHPKVSNWYDSEMIDIAQQKAFRLLSKTGDSRSTGEAQQLNQTLQLLNKGKDTREQQEKIIYTMIPLNYNEEASPNVKILNNIPPEIENALQRVRNKRD